MADRIFENDIHEALKQAWHGKTVIRPDLSLDNNQLNNWDLVETPLFFAGDKPAGFSILQCSDKPELAIGAPFNPLTFKPITNKDFLQLVRDSISGTGHKVTSVGSVRNRGRVFVSIELISMEKFKAAGRDFSAYLNFGNGHDKSSVLWVNTSNTCTVCDNTFSANLFTVEAKDSTATQTDDIKVRVRHTKNAAMKLPALATLIDKAVGVQAEFALELDKLTKVAVDNPQGLFAGFLGRKITEENVVKGLSTRAINTSLRLTTLFKSGDKGNRGENMTDAFSAVTDYYTHESSGGENTMRQVLSSEYGAGQVAKADFWNVCRNPDMTAKMVDRGVKLIAATPV